MMKEAGNVVMEMCDPAAIIGIARLLIASLQVFLPRKCGLVDPRKTAT